MSTASHEFPGSIAAALQATPSAIPVVMGPCGSGRTSLLHRVRDRLAPGGCQYVALDRAISTPERFLEALLASSPFQWTPPAGSPDSPREAFERVAAYLSDARGRSGEPATFLLDEFLEVKTFEHFPGLRDVVRLSIDTVAASPNRFVLGTRFVARMLEALRSTPNRFAVMLMPALSPPDVAADLLGLPGFRSDAAEDAARTVVALTGGRPAYVAELLKALADPSLRVKDPVSILVALLSPGGAIAERCRQSYEFRLHRARGYGALKAVLGVLAEDEPANLTEIALRMQRTPGSTKDYLSWLEDVDLVEVHRKRYSIADPLLRLWILLHTQCESPGESRVAEAVQRFALARLSAERVQG